MTTRRAFITFVGSAAVWPLVARAQQAAKSYRIGYLALLPGEDAVLVKPLLQRLRELGYREGDNLMFEYRSAEGRLERLPELAADIVRAKPDVLIAGFGTLTAQASKAATVTIPVVFVSVGDPLGAGVVASLNRPGGNLTGLSSQASEIGGKRLQVLSELAPGKRIVAALLNPEAPFAVLALEELRTAAEQKGMRVEVFEARTSDQVLAAIDAAGKADVAGLITLEDPLLLGLRLQIADRAAAIRAPIVYGNRDFADAGGLMSYGVDRRDQSRRAADYVDRILKGAKPADLPVEQPTKFELVINLKAAKALGLVISERLLAIADEVIE